MEEKFFTKQQTINMINGMLEILNKPYKHSAGNNLYHDKGNGQWGYVMNKNFGDVLLFMLENNLTSIVDLGAGVGHGIELLKMIGFNVKGYEIEDEFINGNAIMFGKKADMKGNFRSLTIEKKDIMTLITDDIKGFDVIYLWQPLKDIILMKKCLTNLVEIMSPNQIILFKKDGIENISLQEIVEIKKYGTLEIFKK